eukprot:jgi/Ulvmu1/8845/UM049_0026.1
MGNGCIRQALPRQSRQTRTNLLFLGLDGAGKTTIVAAIRQEQVATLPTIGFARPQEVKVCGSNVTIFDVGGAHLIRKIWTQYLSEAHGIVFVVDACDKTRLDEAKFEFSQVLKHRFALQKHVLVIANKQDGQGAMTADAVLDILQPPDEAKPLLHAIGCTGKINSSPSAPDAALVAGLEWLVQAIKQTYGISNSRVKQDHVQYMFDQAEHRRGRLQSGIAKKAGGTPLKPSPFNPTAKHGNAVWPMNKVSGSHASGDGYGQPLGERFGWQAGMLSFGSLLGTVTYGNQCGGNGDMVSRDSGNSSEFQRKTIISVQALQPPENSSSSSDSRLSHNNVP